MLKIVWMVALTLATSLDPAFAQENAVARTLPTSGMSMIAWGFMGSSSSSP